MRGFVAAALAVAALAGAWLLGGRGPGAVAPKRAGTIGESLASLRVQLPNDPVEAPGFTLEGLDGSPVRLADLRGRVVFLNFWATWCLPCLREMPAMERLHRAYRGAGLVVLAVNVQESRAAAEAFVRARRLTFPVALDEDGALTRAYSVRGLPATFLVDRDGKVLWKVLGDRPWDGPEARGYFDRILARRAG